MGIRGRLETGVPFDQLIDRFERPPLDFSSEPDITVVAGSATGRPLSRSLARKIFCGHPSFSILSG